MATETTPHETFAPPEPQEQHEWLQKLVGEWDVEFEMPPAPGQAPEKSTGTESVRSLAGLWVLCEGQSAMPDGSAATTIMTLGYDPEKARFVGTFVASMMNYLWIYDGELDDAKRVLTLHSHGPSMRGDGSMADYRETIEFMSDDHRVFTSVSLGPDGKWQQLMSVHYRRKR